ncbi:MAG: S-methyl-5-thioribose-1-phosphate isomerase [bacterium]
MIKTIEWVDGAVRMIDQLRLPTEEIYTDFHTYREVAEAIRSMIIRGAPAIGVAAAMGVALGCREIRADSFEEFEKRMEPICEHLAATRPTAVNLFWGIEKMKEAARNNRNLPLEELKQALINRSIEICREDIRINQQMGEFGQQLIDDGDTILTHCNAGALATASFGTALGVIRAAHLAGKKIDVYADETRPYLQGARLTAWELNKDNIPVTLITDNMAGYFMQQGRIKKIVVGSDRIAANGDVANKIGTYSVAVLAREHHIPFYVAAPTSTVDPDTPTGAEIPIEERNTREVSHIGGRQMAPSGIKIANPAFDVTPSRLVAAIITEKGIARAPYSQSLRKQLEG